MTENKMTDGTMPNDDAAAGTVSEQARRDWVTPQLERIPLGEAMGVIFSMTQSVADINLYS